MKITCRALIVLVNKEQSISSLPVLHCSIPSHRSANGTQVALFSRSDQSSQLNSDSLQPKK